jgi:hypothetical protein
MTTNPVLAGQADQAASTTMETKIQETEKEDSDVSDSNKKEETWHFQPKVGFQMIQLEDHVTPTQGVQSPRRSHLATDPACGKSDDGLRQVRTPVNEGSQMDHPSKKDVEITNKILARDIAVIDVPNALIQSRFGDEKEMVFVKIRGVCKPCMTVDKKGTKQLLVQC